MLQFENAYFVDLDKGPVVDQLRKPMHYGDDKANRIGVTVTKNGQAVTLSGECTGKAVLGDDTWVMITNGVVDGNEAYIELPSACYSIEGPIRIFLNISSGDTEITLLDLTGYVKATQTDSAIDPDHPTFSVSALEYIITTGAQDQIDAIEEAGAAQIDAIEDKGEEVIASIPSDYTSIVQEAEDTLDQAEALIDAVDDIVLVQSTEPVEEHNKIWVNGDSSSAVQVPTYAEFEAVNASKADTDGSYENMTVGNAEQLVATVGIEDKTPYLYRTSGGTADIGDREVDKIVGGTVCWNQLAYSYVESDVTVVESGDVLTLTPKSYGNRYRMLEKGKNTVTVIQNHVYIQSVVIKSDGEHNVGFQNYRNPGDLNLIDKTKSANWTTLSQVAKSIASGGCYVQLMGSTNFDYQIKKNSFVLYDLTQMFGTAIADYIYSLETATPGAGVAWFRKLFPKDYYDYNPGELISVSGLQSHDMTGFNQWDEEWEVGDIDTSTGQPVANSSVIRSKNFIPVLPNTQYYMNLPTGYIFAYDAEQNFIKTFGINNKPTPENCHYIKFRKDSGYGAVYNHDICINLSWDGERNGEYEPYKLNSYPLDSSLTLRGIPKLDADNKLYFDGDTYESDGTVTRRYGIVDLGTLTWAAGTSSGATFAQGLNSVIKKGNATYGYKHVLSTKYIGENVASMDSLSNYGMSVDSGGNLQVKDPAFVGASAADIKTAMSGVYLVYELATPTTETASPYQNPQIVDDFGTEEYVTDSIVPVGHETTYQANLRAKLEMAPDSPGGDGDYIVRQTNGQNSYVPLAIPNELPALPSTDGTYKLQVTVTDGTPTLSWVSE